MEQAAAAGAHVLYEKPLATTVEDAQAMLAYPVRFSPSFLDARARVRSGQLGVILGIRGTNNGKFPLADRVWFTDPGLAGGGALVDHVVHCADLIDDLLGESAESVRAVSNHIMHADANVAVETGGLVTVRYPTVGLSRQSTARGAIRSPPRPGADSRSRSSAVRESDHRSVRAAHKRPRCSRRGLGSGRRRS